MNVRLVFEGLLARLRWPGQIPPFKLEVDAPAAENAAMLAELGALEKVAIAQQQALNLAIAFAVGAQPGLHAERFRRDVYSALERAYAGIESARPRHVEDVLAAVEAGVAQWRAEK